MMWWFKKKEPTLEEQLAEARIKLARYQLLPEEDFTVRNINSFPMVIKHGVDEKPKAIARVKAQIAELEIRLGTKEENSKG